MNLEELICYTKESGHYLTHIRCSKCSTIFLSMQGEKLWQQTDPHPCFDLNLVYLEVEDERYLGGSCGNLVTVKEIKKEVVGGD